MPWQICATLQWRSYHLIGGGLSCPREVHWWRRGVLCRGAWQRCFTLLPSHAPISLQNGVFADSGGHGRGTTWARNQCKGPALGLAPGQRLRMVYHCHCILISAPISKSSSSLLLERLPKTQPIFFSVKTLTTFLMKR